MTSYTPDPTKHKPHCAEITDAVEYQAALDTYDRAVEMYHAKWPDACEDCQGWGGHVSLYDPSPAGVGLAPGYMADYDPCEHCVSQFKCSRCAGPIKFIEGTDPESGLSTDHHECSGCGWIEEKTEGVPLDPPEPPICDCWSLDDLEE